MKKMWYYMCSGFFNTVIRHKSTAINSVKQ